MADRPKDTPSQDQGKKFPCQKCGAKLDFDPDAQSLKCPYCGHVEVIADDVAPGAELFLEEYLKKGTSHKAVVPGRSSQVTCVACGAVVLLEDKVATDRCPYCNAHLENKPESAEPMIPPASMLPFRLGLRHAIEAFNKWIASRWFAPTALRKLANLGQLTGLYVPYWTYDAMTVTHYDGERGDDYTETEHYTETNAKGETETKTRTVTKTRWSFVSGQVKHFFDDVLICGSQSLPTGLISGLNPWPLDELEGFRPQVLSGFQTERYAVSLSDGFDAAKEEMDGKIRSLCCQDIGGNHQRLHSVRTRYSAMTFKHILLPVWLALYRYRNETYRILINGCTGKVNGTRPYSWVKIALLVLGILLVIGLIIALVMGLGATAGSQMGH